MHLIYPVTDITPHFPQVESAMDPEISNTPAACLIVANGDSGEFPEELVSAAVIIEDQIIVRDIPTWPDAFVLLFGLLYVLKIQYPHKVVQTFTFTQKMLMDLDDCKTLKPCLQLQRMTSFWYLKHLDYFVA